MYRSYLQNRNRDTDIENKYIDTKRDRHARRNWEVGTDRYILLILSVK